MIKTAQPSEELTAMGEAMFLQLWEPHVNSQQRNTKTLKKDGKRIKAQVKQLLDRIIEADNVTVASAYKKTIKKLERIV